MAISSQEAVEASMMNTYFTDKRDTAGSLVPQLNMLNGDKWGKILTLVWTVNIFALMRLLQYIERLTQNLGSCTIIKISKTDVFNTNPPPTFFQSTASHQSLCTKYY